MKKSFVFLLTLFSALISSQLQAQTVPFTYTGTSPVAFQMDSSGDLSSIGTYGTGTYSLTGAGTRMFWYPGKAAFRAGYVSGTQWDNTNIGAYSVALGNSTTASGPDATALGQLTTASGTYSLAGGWDSTASSTASWAFGMASVASGYTAVALGQGTTASGESTLAVGKYGTASGAEAMSVGFGAAAIGNYSTALGSFTTASGTNSSALGYVTTATAYDSIAVGTYNTGLSQTGTAASATAWVAADPLFEVGNGTGTGANAKDALVVYKDGTAKFANTVQVPQSGDIPMYTGN